MTYLQWNTRGNWSFKNEDSRSPLLSLLALLLLQLAVDMAGMARMCGVTILNRLPSWWDSSNCEFCILSINVFLSFTLGWSYFCMRLKEKRTKSRNHWILFLFTVHKIKWIKPNFLVIDYDYRKRWKTSENDFFFIEVIFHLPCFGHTLYFVYSLKYLQKNRYNVSCTALYLFSNGSLFKYFEYISLY